MKDVLSDGATGLQDSSQVKALVDTLVQAGVTSAREVEEMLAAGNMLYAGQLAVIGRDNDLALGAKAGGLK